MAEPLTGGERHLLGEKFDRWLTLRDDQDPKAKRAERRLAAILARHYRNRVLVFAGDAFVVDRHTPAGTITTLDLDEVG